MLDFQTSLVYGRRMVTAQDMVRPPCDGKPGRPSRLKFVMMLLGDPEKCVARAAAGNEIP
jgi:hypothetical protein